MDEIEHVEPKNSINCVNLMVRSLNLRTYLNQVSQECLVRHMDSLLSPFSRLRKKINKFTLIRLRSIKAVSASFMTFSDNQQR